MRAFGPVDLAAIAEGVMRSGVNGILPSFPRAIAPGEDVKLYRHSVQRVLRAWVRAELYELPAFPTDEHDAQIICEHRAAEEIGRALYEIETKLIAEGVRDIVLAHRIAQENEADEIAMRLHRPGRLFA